MCFSHYLHSSNDLDRRSESVGISIWLRHASMRLLAYRLLALLPPINL